MKVTSKVFVGIGTVVGHTDSETRKSYHVLLDSGLIVEVLQKECLDVDGPEETVYTAGGRSMSH